MSDSTNKLLIHLEAVEHELMEGYSALGVAWGTIDGQTEYPELDDRCLNDVIKTSIETSALILARLSDHNRRSASLSTLIQNLKSKQAARILLGDRTWDGTDEDANERLNKALDRAESLFARSENFLQRVRIMRDKVLAHLDRDLRLKREPLEQVMLGEIRDFLNETAEVCSDIRYAVEDKSVGYSNIFDQVHREALEMTHRLDIARRYLKAVADHFDHMPLEVIRKGLVPPDPVDIITALPIRK